MTHEPIAYTYEADVHCSSCAEERFEGHCIAHEQLACCVEDSEGNTPGAIAPWDEWHIGTGGCETLACGDCACELAHMHVEDCSCDEEPTP